MSVTCECGEQVREGQTFCRHCGKRVGASREVGDRTRELTQIRPVAPPPGKPPAPQGGGSGPSLRVILGGVLAVLAVAGGVYAFTSLGTPSDDDGDAGNGGGNGSGKVPPRPQLPPYREACGNDVYAAGTASCSFSRNIAAQYRDSPNPVLYDVYSPETELTYEVACEGSKLIKCTGGVSAKVYFYP